MPKYIVILHDALDSSQAGRAELKLRLAENLHVSKKTVEGIFEALPVIISRDLEQATAERYAETLEALGAVAEVIEQSAPIDHSTPDTGSSSATTPRESDVEIQDLEQLLDDALGAEESAHGTVQAPLNDHVTPAAETPIEEEDWSLAGIQLDEEPAAKPKAAQPLFMLEDDAPAETSARPSLLHDLMHFEATAAEPVDRPVASSGSQRIPEAVPGESEAEPTGPAFRPGGSSGTHRVFQPAEPAPQAPETQPAVEQHVSGSFPARQSFFKRTKHLAVASAVLVLVVVVLFGKQTLLALTGQGGQRMTISFDVDSLLREQSNIFGTGKTDDTHIPVITGQWVGELNESNVQANIRLTEYDGSIGLAALRVTTVQPPPLTQQELVAGKPLPVWLRRLDASALPPLVGPDPLEPPGGAGILFSGIGKAYLEDGKGSGRVSVRVRVLVERVPDSPADLKIQWMATRLAEPVAFEGESAAARVNANDFRVLFHGSAPVHKEDAAKTEIGAHSK